MWWTRYSMWFSPPLTLLMNPTCLLWLKKTKIPRPLDWDRPRIIPLPAPPPSRPHTTTPDPNNCEQSTKLPVKTRKLTATSIRFLSHIWRNCRFVKLCTYLANLYKMLGLYNIIFLFWPVFIWQIFLEKKTLAGCLLKQSGWWWKELNMHCR